MPWFGVLHVYSTSAGEISNSSFVWFMKVQFVLDAQGGNASQHKPILGRGSL